MIFFLKRVKQETDGVRLKVPSLLELHSFNWFAATILFFNSNFYDYANQSDDRHKLPTFSRL